MHRQFRAFCATIILALVVTAAAYATLDFQSLSSGDALASTRAATAKFADLATAKEAGYGLLKDKNGVACIAMDGMPEMGAMGVHYANSGLVGDGELHLNTPEALVYAPAANAKLRLAALEYVVIKSAWDAKHNAAPVMFGHKLNFTPAGNRFGLPAYYSLHVWLFKHNPAGRFAMWNPSVSCGGYR